MIVFDLRCGGGHVFEAWFGSSGAYEEQRAGGRVACPICGDCDIAKAKALVDDGVSVAPLPFPVVLPEQAN